jgi:bacteriorhodopsin
MDVGYIVGIVTAVVIIICGIVGAIAAKLNNRTSKWPFWTIIFGIAALISAAVNYSIFS